MGALEKVLLVVQQLTEMSRNPHKIRLCMISRLFKTLSMSFRLFPLIFRRAFELELAEGKSRLRKVFSSGSSPRKKHPLASFFDIQAVGVQSRPPPESSPPPLPPAPASGKCFASYSLRPVNGEVPRAPKLTNFGGASAESRKGRMVAPNGPSARYCHIFLLFQRIIIFGMIIQIYF